MKAGISLYEAGGLALLLLGIVVVGATLMVRFMMAMIRDLGTRLNGVQDQQTGLLVGVIKENTEASREMRMELAHQTNIIAQQTEALRARPCLIDTGVYPKLPALAPLHQR
jgi:hypothetical protein